MTGKMKDNNVPGRPVIVFDVNETLLDLDALRPTFDRIFNDPAAMRLWFADLILYSDQLIERYPAVANVS
jgi:2-haloacid dehalogenase